MSPVLRPSETIVCSVVLAPFLGISYLWYLFTSLPIVDLGYENYQASSFNQAAGYYAFSDIRYAAPPLGDLRFRPPIPPAENRAFLQQEDRPSRICPQGRVRWEYGTGHDFLQTINGTTMSTYNAPPSFYDTPSNSFETEDCLFLDIFVPQAVFESRQEIAQTEKPGAPVVMWIHGGEGLSGSKTLPAQPFDILKHGLFPRSFRPDATVVLVSVNYRLGAFGAFGDLGRPSDSSLEQNENVSASIGIQDQRMAIRWVREKIKLFGGDAGRVSIIRGVDGSTAGVHGLYHTTASDERVLRQHTVLPGDLTVKNFLRLANVSSLAEARSLPSEKLIAANKALMDMLV